MSRRNLASYMVNNNRFEEAVKEYKILANDYLETLGPDHVETLNNQFLLALVLNQSSLFAEAETIFTDLLKCQASIFGEKDMRTVDTRHNLAATLADLEKSEEAKILLLENIPHQTELHGENHVQTLAANYLFNMLLLDENPNRENAISFSRLINRIELHFGSDNQLVVTGRQVLDEIIEKE